MLLSHSFPHHPSLHAAACSSLYHGAHAHTVVFHECGHVKQVLVNSAAAASCEVFPGDELLSIDGVSTRDMTAAQVSIPKSSLYIDAL